MAISPFGRYSNFNDAAQSAAAGKVISIPPPASAAIRTSRTQRAVFDALRDALGPFLA